MNRFLRNPTKNLVLDSLDRVQKKDEALSGILQLLIRRNMISQVVIFVLLAFGLIATVFGAVMGNVSEVDTLVDLLDFIAAIAGSVSTILTGILLVLKRIQKQLEFDWMLLITRKA